MNFGKWIVVAFIAFAIFIGTLVTVCVRQDISLVSRNYYQDELNYQQQIEREKNTNALSDKPTIRISDETLKIEFPYFEEVEQGELKLFRPSNDHWDKTFALHAVEDDILEFDIKTFPRGMYKARMQWSMMGKEYFLEQMINI